MAESYSTGPALQGKGPFAPLRFLLDQPKVAVGRVPPADLVLDDGSVSRLHAEVFRSGSRFGVRDLGSARGTFLNGERVSEAPLKPGDVVRFGTVELVFEAPDPLPIPGRSRRRVVVALAAGGLLSALGAALWLARTPKAPKNPPPPIESSAESFRRALGRCLGHSDPDGTNLAWAQAVKACQEAVDLDPTHDDARALLKRARRELELEALLREATLKAATSQEEDALLLLQTIDRDSSAFSKATSKFREVQEILFKRNQAQCKADCETGRFEESLPACLRALQLTCNGPDGADPETLRYYQNAARQIGRSKDFDCPPNPFQVTALAKPEPRQIRFTSPDPKLFRPLMTYLREGGARRAAEQLKLVRASDPVKRPVVAEMIVMLEVIDARFATWQGLVRERRAHEALPLLQEVAEAEARLFGTLLDHAPQPSRLLREMQAGTAQLFLSLGREEAGRGRSDLSFAHVEQGYRLEPGNADLGSLLVQLEREASARLAREQTCESFRFVTSTTRSDTTLHARAAELAFKAGCPAVE